MLIKLAVRHVIPCILALSSAVLTVHARPSASESALASGNIGRRATVCNGHAELCDRSFGNVTFVGAHDSYAIGVNNRALLWMEVFKT